TLEAVVQTLPVASIEGPPGCGKSLILQHLHARMGGVFIDAGQAFEAIGDAPHPLAFEESLLRLFQEAFSRGDLILFDTMSGLARVSIQPGYTRQYVFTTLE